MIRSKMGATIGSLLAILIVFSPVREYYKEAPKDGFPLSHYPMFSSKRAATYPLRYVVGYTEEGERLLVPYKLIGTGGFNQVRKQIIKMDKNEQGELLLEQVAQRIQAKGNKQYRKIKRLELVKGWYHLENYFLHKEKAPTKEITLASKTI